MKRTGRFFWLKSFLIVVFLAGPVASLVAQTAPPNEKEGYAQVIAKRAGKIVAALNSNDSAFNYKVQNIVIDQYYNLSITYDARSTQIAAIKQGKSELTDDEKAHIQRIETKTAQQLDRLHSQYLERLSELCTPEQVDQIKDGMTYGVLQVTYKAYQDMIPTLNNEQKKQILTWLTEARELAMDAESSEKKHAVFGKYKGRINNYLSTSGIDLKQAEADWQKRRAAAKQ